MSQEICGIRNLTTHVVRVLDPEDHSVVLYAFANEGVVARAEAWEETQNETIIGIPVIKKVIKGLDDLPDPTDNIMLIVSHLTAEAAQKAGRTTDDLLIPTRLVRDNGRIIGCTAFEMLS